MNQSAVNPRMQADPMLRFEALLAELSVRFINLGADKLGVAIEDAQRLVCESLSVDRLALFLVCEENPNEFLLTHLYQAPGCDRPAIEKEEAPVVTRCVRVFGRTNLVEPYIAINLSRSFPWVYQRLRDRETIVVPDIERLPAEASTDRDGFRSDGTKSTVLVPLLEGDNCIGYVTFTAMREARLWSNLEVRLFEFVARIFTSVLTRSRVELALRESQARLALATESAGAGLWCIEGSTRHVWATVRTRELFNFQPEEELTVERFCSAVLSEDRDLVVESIERSLQSGEEFLIECRVALPDGSPRWISSRGSRVLTPAGDGRLTGASVDVTARKGVDAQLRESEQRFRTLVEQAGDGFELLDPNGRYLDVNDATLRQLGYTRQEMLRLEVFDVAPGLSRAQFFERAALVGDGSPLSVESIHRRKDGSTFPVEVTVTPIQLGGKECLLTLVRDITVRKKAEEALTRSFEEIESLKQRLEAERAYLKNEIRVTHPHGQIIGRSLGIKRVLHQVEQVAPAECPVLISGETGTGKELIGQEIHRLSRRRERLMVLVNCAALPAGLVESELFGRERGAYTGALTTQVGRFEFADGSTIFLDEVGELSMEVQAKLLRILQEGEFQRLGCPKTLKVDVRVIAATNRDLAEEVRKSRFREDLYYRLKVFPIDIPPLRERVEDISPLVFAFVEEFSTRMGKKITKVPRNAMERLEEHAWPGNVRELRNVIEHSVILSSGDVLKLSNLGDAPTREVHAVTLAEAERAHILKTLESTGWRIKGPHGAARRLDLEPSTLYSRMQKLGIPNRRQKDELSAEGPMPNAVSRATQKNGENITVF